MAKLKVTRQEAMAALEYAAVVLIGGLLILAIPILGPLLSKLPSWTVGPTVINLAAIIAGAAAILIYSLLKAQFKN